MYILVIYVNKSSRLTGKLLTGQFWCHVDSYGGNHISEMDLRSCWTTLKLMCSSYVVSQSTHEEMSDYEKEALLNVTLQ